MVVALTTSFFQIFFALAHGAMKLIDLRLMHRVLTDKGADLVLGVVVRLFGLLDLVLEGTDSVVLVGYLFVKILDLLEQVGVLDLDFSFLLLEVKDLFLQLLDFLHQILCLTLHSLHLLQLLRHDHEICLQCVYIVGCLCAGAVAICRNRFCLLVLFDF